MTYTIEFVKKTGVNTFTEPEHVGTFEADLIGPAKRAASEYLNNWLIDKKLCVRTRGEWVKDVKRHGFSREYLLTDNGTPTKYIFIMREA